MISVLKKSGIQSKIDHWMERLEGVSLGGSFPNNDVSFRPKVTPVKEDEEKDNKNIHMRLAREDTDGLDRLVYATRGIRRPVLSREMKENWISFQVERLVVEECEEILLVT